jgi:hypothetical protein
MNPPDSQFSNPAHFATVSRWVLRLQQHAQRDRELKLHQDRLDLERYKFEYSASRAALNYLPELNDIMDKHPGDNEDKIWAAREKLFPPRSDLVENPNLQPASIAPSAPTTTPERGFVRGAQSAAQTQAP